MALEGGSIVLNGHQPCLGQPLGPASAVAAGTSWGPAAPGNTVKSWCSCWVRAPAAAAGGGRRRESGMKSQGVAAASSLQGAVAQGAACLLAGPQLRAGCCEARYNCLPVCLLYSQGFRLRRVPDGRPLMHQLKRRAAPADLRGGLPRAAAAAHGGTPAAARAARSGGGGPRCGRPARARGPCGAACATHGGGGGGRPSGP